MLFIARFACAFVMISIWYFLLHAPLYVAAGLSVIIVELAEITVYLDIIRKRLP